MIAITSIDMQRMKALYTDDHNIESYYYRKVSRPHGTIFENLRIHGYSLTLSRRVRSSILRKHRMSGHRSIILIHDHQNIRWSATQSLATRRPGRRNYPLLAASTAGGLFRRTFLGKLDKMPIMKSCSSVLYAWIELWQFGISSRTYAIVVK